MAAAWALIFAVALVAVLSVPRRTKAGKRKPGAKIIRAHRRHRINKPSELDMGMVLTEVATRLRSGSAVAQAWNGALAHYQLDRIVAAGEPVLDGAGVPSALRSIWRSGKWTRSRLGVSPVAAEAIPAAIAVCRMGNSTGAPMAEILDSCAAGVTEAAEARSARDVALAGPQSSARMLAVLPFFGIALGFVMGADPFSFLFGSIWGRLALAGAVTLEALGIVLVKRMVRRAQQEADIQ